MATSNKQIQIALEIAVAAHKNVTRRNGDLYITHVMRVANNKSFILNKTAMAVALLHDVVEDTPITFDYLKQQGISEEVIEVLKYVTRDKTMPYETYISNLCNNLDAMLVKLSDLNDNLDTATLKTITEADEKRFLKYETARVKILATLLNKYPKIFNEIYKQ